MTTIKPSATSFFGRHLTKEIAFMDGMITIRALSLSDMTAFQELAATGGGDISLMKYVATRGVPDWKDATDEQLISLPMPALVSLTEAIMDFSGAGASGKEN